MKKNVLLAISFLLLSMSVSAATDQWVELKPSGIRCDMVTTAGLWAKSILDTEYGKTLFIGKRYVCTADAKAEVAECNLILKTAVEHKSTVLINVKTGEIISTKGHYRELQSAAVITVPLRSYGD